MNQVHLLFLYFKGCYYYKYCYIYYYYKKFHMYKSNFFYSFNEVLMYFINVIIFLIKYI
jgi:hypothetical protein